MLGTYLSEIYKEMYVVYLNNYNTQACQPVKRTVFISYYHEDQHYVNQFVQDFKDVFIPKTVGVTEGDFEFDSNNSEYIMRKIREEKLKDSTVTIVLIGNYTYKRKYVDWEIKASLQCGQNIPNGLIAIKLPYIGNNPVNLPTRLKENINNIWHSDKYARLYHYPSSNEELRIWIEDAYKARTKRRNLIKNSNSMMHRNLV